MAIPTNGLQVLGPVRTAMRPELPVMELQQVCTAAACAPPAVLIEDLPAVQPVNGTHQQVQGNPLVSMSYFCDQLIATERPVAGRVLAIRERSDFATSQRFRFSPRH